MQKRFLISLILMLFMASFFNYKVTRFFPTISRGGSYFKIFAVQAAELPRGGESIDGAAIISAGTYSIGQMAEKEARYFQISVKAGQELEVSGTFVAIDPGFSTNNTIEIFDDNKGSLTSEMESAGTAISQKTLASSSKDIHTYIIKITDDTWGTASGEVKIALNDKYDASTKTDAPDNFAKALAVASGNYKGYLSQIDTDDYFKISAKKGPISVKVTPASKDMIPTVKIYDANHKEIESKISKSAGAIVTASTDLIADGEAFFSINCDINTGCGSLACEYNMEINFVGNTETNNLPTENITPNSPTLAKIHDQIFPILKEVFQDKVTLKEQKDITTLVYIVGRTISDFDFRLLREAMEGADYKLQTSSENQFVVKKGTEELTFAFNIGDGDNPLITVSVKKIINWKLWGPILGTALLIAIIAIVIIVKKKKAQNEIQEKPEKTRQIKAKEQKISKIKKKKK